MITYKGTPITAVYHAISSGKTESAKDIWNAELDYLVPVSSEGDKLATNYISEVEFTAKELKERLSDKAELSGEAKDYFSNLVRTKSGTVLKVNVCGQELKGSLVRELLELRSSNFTVEYRDEKFVFSVYGYGHGVGMSQNGANYMAKQGSTFEEILTHYYTGCKVEKVKITS
jgi:stage II sporulation protein D